MCSNCGIRPTYAKGRCRRCYRYLASHGEDKPLWLLEKEHERQMERLDLQRIWRHANFLADAS